MLITVVALLAVLGGAFLWVRDSSLVTVQRVRVTGASGPDAGRIRSALIAAARTMTTLDVQMNQLQMAVEPYPVVKRLEVSTQFPHGMRIQVIEQVPVAILVASGRRFAVAADGTLLHAPSDPGSLPTISVPVPPGGSHLSGAALSEIHLLAAAPYVLLSKIGAVSDSGLHGLLAQLRNGPSIYFGDAGQLPSKWRAATAVLADSGSTGAVYVDVTDPNRPAAGAGSDSTATPSSTATPGSTGAPASTATPSSTGAPGSTGAPNSATAPSSGG